MQEVQEQQQPHQAAPVAGRQPEAPVEAGAPKPVARRHALRALIAGATAAAGAALLGVTRPEKASANPPVQGTGTATVPGVEGDNTAGGPGVLGDVTGAPPGSMISAGVWGRGGSAAAVQGDGLGVTGVRGTTTSSGSPAVEGDQHGSAPAVLGNNTGGGIAVQGTNGGMFPAIQGDNPGNVLVKGPGVKGTGDIGVWGVALGTGSLGIGVEGDSSFASPGVYGFNNGTGPGVLGRATSSTGVGVAGKNNAGIGVYGISTGYYAVYGYGANGVYGNAVGSGGGAGVTGASDSGVGILGASTGGYGVYGSCTSGPGIWGTSGANGGIGVVGVNDTGPNSIGVYGGSANGYAGYFAGKVHISGGLVSQAPHVAAVKGSDGTLRSMHSMASPESWFEDFGSGTLSGGVATVKIPSDFAAVVQGDGYHVFLTPRGETNGLYVSNQAATSFEVREAHGGNSGVSFSYRLVAKSRDIAGTRMQRIAEPPAAPKPPERPKLPEPPANIAEPPTPSGGVAGGGLATSHVEPMP